MSLSNNNNNNNNNGRRIGGGPAPFLMKTHGIVEDEGTNDVISWGETGNSFVVWKLMEFARDLLPVHFKHNNFSSFVRQLNTYGFRKVVPDRWEYANDSFRRGDRDLLCEICRRKVPSNSSSAKKLNKSNKSNKNSTTTSSTPTLSSTSSLPLPPTEDLVILSNENEKLKKANRILNNELTQAKKQCEQLLSFMYEDGRVNDINASLLMKQAALAGVDIKLSDQEEKMNIEEDKKEEDVACLKLFGVILKATTSGSRKRGRCEDGSAREEKWMMTNSHKVCN